MSAVRRLWKFRWFILGSVQREVQTKYRGSLLSFAWMIIQPMVMIFIYTVIFSQLMQAKLPGVDGSFSYSIYLCAGILTWGLFAEIMQRMVVMFIDNANLIKKFDFPRLCLPFIIVLGASVNFIIILGLFFVFLLLSGNFPGFAVLALAPLVLVQILFAAGLGGVLGILNVFFRDVGQLLGVMLQFWFWFTPIVYPVRILPEWAASLVQMNPLLPLIEAYQIVLVTGGWPDWGRLGFVAGLGSLLCIFSLWMFKKHEADMVDEL